MNPADTDHKLLTITKTASAFLEFPYLFSRTVSPADAFLAVPRPVGAESFSINELETIAKV